MKLKWKIIIFVTGIALIFLFQKNFPFLALFTPSSNPPVSPSPQTQSLHTNDVHSGDIEPLTKLPPELVKDPALTPIALREFKKCFRPSPDGKDSSETKPLPLASFPTVQAPKDLWNIARDGMVTQWILHFSSPASENGPKVQYRAVYNRFLPIPGEGKAATLEETETPTDGDIDLQFYKVDQDDLPTLLNPEETESLLSNFKQAAEITSAQVKLSSLDFVREHFEVTQDQVERFVKLRDSNHRLQATILAQWRNQRPRNFKIKSSGKEFLCEPVDEESMKLDCRCYWKE